MFSKGAAATENGRLAFIGDSVEIRRNGEILAATIRYIRPGYGYKVSRSFPRQQIQFPDGHFEWVSGGDFVLRQSRRGDHEAYSEGPPPETRLTSFVTPRAVYDEV